MKLEHIKTSTKFRDYIAGYATMSIRDKHDFKFDSAALPDGFVELYFFKYGSVSLKSSGHFSLSNMNTGFMIGQTNKKIDFTPNEKLDFFTVKLYPWTAKYFFREKASDYSNKVLFLSDFNDKALLNLQEKIINSKSTSESIHHIEKFLENIIKRDESHSDVVETACNYIFESMGLFEIKMIANKLGVSTQYLERLFVEYVGISPKQLSKVVKIRALSAYQKANPKVSLTELAYQFNYFDQSHFVKDFKKFVDETPGKFFRKDNFILKYFPFDC